MAGYVVGKLDLQQVVVSMRWHSCEGAGGQDSMLRVMRGRNAGNRTP